MEPGSTHDGQSQNLGRNFFFWTMLTNDLPTVTTVMVNMQFMTSGGHKISHVISYRIGMPFARKILSLNWDFNGNGPDFLYRKTFIPARKKAFLNPSFLTAGMSLGDMAPTLVGSVVTREKELEIYSTIGSTAVLLWDIILHTPEDYEQIRKQGFLKLSRIVYCFSRFATLFYMLALCVLHTAPIGNCAWVRYIGYVFPLTVPITLSLFLFRVYALFQNRNYVLVSIFLSWLLVLGSTIAVAVQTEGVNINGTKFCTKKTKGRDISDAVSTITRFFHDTIVFIVTSWWLYQSNSTDDSGFASALFGRHLFPLTRSLLHDGQAYYLATLLLNVVVIALPLMDKPFVTPCTLGSPLLVLISNMACHVYRNLVSAKYRDHCEFLQWVDGEWREHSTEAAISDAMRSVKP